MTVSGVVKSVNAEFASGRVNKRAKASGLYLIYLEANSLVNARQVGRSCVAAPSVFVFSNLLLPSSPAHCGARRSGSEHP